MASEGEREARLEEETLRSWEREQAELKANVIEQDTQEWQSSPSFAGLKRVGGVDLSYVKGDDTSACASLVVLSYPNLEVLYEDCCMVSVGAPYVAGFLAFREVPFLVEALQRLEERNPAHKPQVLLVDGNGILHHRGFGMACHLGVLTGLPCIGVAKNLLQVDGLASDELHKEQIQDLQDGDSFPLPSSSGRILGMADIRSREYIRKHLEATFTPLPKPERWRCSEEVHAQRLASVAFKYSSSPISFPGRLSISGGRKMAFLPEGPDWV
uniref:Endonuclease V isoform X4 n=1 Tax=Pogona vitticeps TaxID=103695 RepID=A0ABM5FN23_9SAUR